jgi:hypothetical protein
MTTLQINLILRIELFYKVSIIKLLIIKNVFIVIK